MFSSNQTNVSVAVNYIEDVFSTWLYTGTGSSQTITNNIDLSTKGGLTWIKSRSAATDHKLTDTARGVTKALISDTNGAQTTDTTGLTAFGTTGFTIGADSNYNTSAATYASWTFREQPKFFDVVTYSGTGTTQNIPHSLGSVPGCIIVKNVTASGSWYVYHRSNANTQAMLLNGTQAAFTAATVWDSTTPTSTQFTVGASSSSNESGQTFVAYLFAHDAGGFGLTGTDNVISCGTYTGNGGTRNVNLGYEPQLVMVKRTDSTGNWAMIDTMRGWTAGDSVACEQLYANLSNALTFDSFFGLTSTGFGGNNGDQWNVSSATYIYIAIRRGPMKVPTDATKVFYSRSSWGAGTFYDIGFTADMAIFSRKDGDNSSQNYPAMTSRLINPKVLITSDTTAEVTKTDLIYYTYGPTNNFGQGLLFLPAGWAFGRAPGYMDVVCYTGTGSNATQTHNLGAVPELMIVKGRSGTTAWQAYSSALANTEYLVLNTTAAKATGSTRWNSTTPTSSVFSIGTASEVNTSSATYVAYLFATCAGVSKVGTYTGTGATQTIDCGFTGGARFVLIKRTDDVGDWYVWDTARGMISGTDPSLLLNSTAAEVNANSIYTATTGFQIVSTAAGINASAGTYIFLAIA